MRELGRAYNTIKDNLDDAKYKELVFTNGDLVIKRENNNNLSLYEKFRDECMEENIIGNIPVQYGFIIDINESNPLESISYIDDNTEFTSIISPYDGTIRYNSWTKKILRNVFGIRPCIMNNGVITAYLDPDDYTKTIEGVSTELLRGDIMVEYKRMYYKFIKTKDSIIFKIANFEVDETYTCLAFNKSEHMYIAAYNSFIDEDTLLVSRPNKSITIDSTIADLFNKVTGEYKLMDIYKYQYIIFLSMLFTKCTNPLLVFGKNISEYTGQLDNRGLFYNGSKGNKILGLENLYQYYTYIDKVNTAKNKLYLNTTGIKTKIADSVIENGWIDKVSISDDNVMYPVSYNGSSSTYYGSYVTGNDGSLNFSYLSFGGLDTNPSYVGSLSLKVCDNLNYITCRLCYED